MPLLGPGLCLKKFRSRRRIIIKEGVLDFTHCVLIRGARSSWLSKSMSFKLTRPFGWRIAQARDANAAGEAALNDSRDQGWSDEGH